MPQGLHSFPFPLNLSLVCFFPLNCSLLCPPYGRNQPVNVSRKVVEFSANVSDVS